MSRIGNRIITVPAGVTVELNDNVVTVKGPKGELKQTMLKDISMKQEGDNITLERANENAKAMHGTMNALINNMIIGVTKGYEKGLEIIGVGYRFNVQGKKLVINAGYSHPVEMQVPEGLTVKANGNTEITVEGIDNDVIHLSDAEDCYVEDFKPYLRPMSSMTEEENEEFEELFISYSISRDRNCVYHSSRGDLNLEIIDWLNAHHFDYRGLIEKGLAVEVTEENNPYKN